jgi:hypothetical protein
MIYYYPYKQVILGHTKVTVSYYNDWCRIRLFCILALFGFYFHKIRSFQFHFKK